MATIPQRKYRPYFTLNDLRDIRLALASLNHTGPIKPIETYIDGFIKEIEFGIRKEAHITKPKETIEDKLGFTLTEEKSSADHRYLNDLMSPEEEKEYEKANGIAF
jgi:hypothetical protein